MTKYNKIKLLFFNPCIDYFKFRLDCSNYNEFPYSNHLE